MHTDDVLQLQRLVDGHLDHAQTRQLLIEAEAHPGQWRDIAVAFLENQAWQIEIAAADREYAGDQLREPSRVQSGTISAPAIAIENSGTKLRGKSARLNQRYGWLSLVATALVAVAGGFYAGRLAIDRSGSPLADKGISSHLSDVTGDLSGVVDSSEFGKPPVSLVNYKPDYHMQLLDADGNRLFDGEVPLFDAQHARELGYRIALPTVSEDLKNSLHNAGYQLQFNVRLISGNLENGSRFVVPVQTIKLVSGQ